MIIDKLLLNEQEIILKIFDSFEKNEKLLLTYLNQHSYNIYFRNQDYKNILDSHSQVYQADSGIFLLLKYLKKKNISKINATNFNKIILSEIIKRKIPVSIIGGKFSEEFISDECLKKNIILAGYHQGYFNDSEYEKVITKVKQDSSRFYFVGMGVPKQEYFAYRLAQKSESKIIICVGNYFEFYFGTIKRAPAIFQKTGSEWLFRLITEPKRLWKRYLLGIPEFIYRAMKKNKKLS